MSTTKGDVEVENLKAGDKVLTKDGEAEKVCWIGRKVFSRAKLEKSPKLYPVRILAGSLGQNLPKQDLLVSQQHYVLVKSAHIMEKFGVGEALIKAKHLEDVADVYVDYTVDSVEYFHILLDDHEVIFANGVPSETLYLGSEAKKMLDEDALSEIRTIFPEAFDFELPYAAFVPEKECEAKEAIWDLRNSIERRCFSDAI